MALESRWYIAPYEDVSDDRPRRRVIVDQLTSTIFGEGGAWTEAEANGVTASGQGWAIVKVRAEPATHALVAALPGVKAIPPSLGPSTTLGTLTNGQRTTLRGWLNQIGYDNAEIDAKLGSNWTNVTLRQLFDFLTQNNALVAFSGGAWRFGRLQRKSVAEVEAELPD